MLVWPQENVIICYSYVPHICRSGEKNNNKKHSRLRQYMHSKHALRTRGGVSTNAIPLHRLKYQAPFNCIRITFKYASYLCHLSWHAVDTSARKALWVFVHGKLLVWFRNPFKPSEVNQSGDDIFIMFNATTQPGNKLTLSNNNSSNNKINKICFIAMPWNILFIMYAIKLYETTGQSIWRNYKNSKS